MLTNYVHVLPPPPPAEMQKEGQSSASDGMRRRPAYPAEDEKEVDDGDEKQKQTSLAELDLERRERLSEGLRHRQSQYVSNDEETLVHDFPVAAGPDTPTCEEQPEELCEQGTEDAEHHRGTSPSIKFGCGLVRWLPFLGIPIRYLRRFRLGHLFRKTKTDDVGSTEAKVNWEKLPTL